MWVRLKIVFLNTIFFDLFLQIQLIEPSVLRKLFDLLVQLHDLVDVVAQIHVLHFAARHELFDLLLNTLFPHGLGDVPNDHCKVTGRNLFLVKLETQTHQESAEIYRMGKHVNNAEDLQENYDVCAGEVALGV